jgi:membrane protease YdiL (CAAX protease family)
MEIKTKLIALAKITGVYIGFYLIFLAISYPVQWIFTLEFRRSDAWGIIGQGLLTIVTVFFFFLVLKIFGKKSKPASGIGFTKNWYLRYLTGIGIGILCIIILWIFAIVFGGMSSYIKTLNSEQLNITLIFLVVFLLVGISEEITARGYMAYAGHTGGRIFSAITISIIFAVVHPWGNMNVFSILNLFLWSIYAFLITWLSGDLWVVMGFHFSWNAAMGCLFGVPVSGRIVEGIFESKYTEQNFINGGDYGLEGTFTCSILLLLLIGICIYLMKHNKIKNNSEVLWLK